MLQIVLLLLFVIPAILFLLTQQKILSSIVPGNRLMNPGQVWLQIIPLFGQFWQFIVVSRISGSIYRELETQNDDSILGIANAEVAAMGDKPTYAIGIAQCTLWSVWVLLRFFNMNFSPVLAILALLIMLSGMACWILYWVSLSRYLKIIQRKGLLKQQTVH